MPPPHDQVRPRRRPDRAIIIQIEALPPSEHGAQTSKEAHEITTINEGVESLDGNGVDLDSELVKLSDNATRYNVQLELLRRQIAILRYAAGMGSGQ